MKPKILQIAPNKIELYWKEKPSDVLLQHLISWENLLLSTSSDKLLEIRKGYQTLSCLMKDPLSKSDLLGFQNLISAPIKLEALSTKVWEIPVCYEIKFGTDLAFLAKTKGMDIEQVVEIHSNKTYRIHFYGFLPGFMYLNGLDPRLHFDRKEIPDRKILSGSVAIGGAQTGIYPSESPGGWHIIGRSPIRFFNPNFEIPVFGKAGEQIKFKPINRSEFEDFSQQPSLLFNND